MPDLQENQCVLILPRHHSESVPLTLPHIHSPSLSRKEVTKIETKVEYNGGIALLSFIFLKLHPLEQINSEPFCFENDLVWTSLRDVQ